jgi:hypothetical protein
MRRVLACAGLLAILPGAYAATPTIYTTAPQDLVMSASMETFRYGLGIPAGSATALKPTALALSPDGKTFYAAPVPLLPPASAQMSNRPAAG